MCRKAIPEIFMKIGLAKPELKIGKNIRRKNGASSPSYTSLLVEIVMNTWLASLAKNLYVCDMM